MTARLVFNFSYDAELGYVADSVDMGLKYEKLFLDYRPACYVLVKEAANGASGFLTPHVLRLADLVHDLLQLQRQQGGAAAAAEAVSSYVCYVTDIMLRGERANFIQCLVNDLGQDATPDFTGRLMIVEFSSHPAYKLIYDSLRNNSLPWYRVLPNICEIGLAIQIYKSAFGTSMVTKGTPPHVECLGFPVTDRMELLERFLPVGFYHTFNGTGAYTKLNLLNRKLPALQHILPVVSIDIETIARSAHVIPMGTTHDEKISSISMYLFFGRLHVHVCLYLNPKGACDATAAAEFQSKMNSKYNNNNDRRTLAVFRGFETETVMLEAFCDWYCNGDIFLLVALPQRFPHVLTGHNVIAYDLRVIWRRAIFLRVERLLHAVRRIKYEHDELYHPEFNDLAIVLDLMVIAKRNMLSDKMSLAAIAANRLREEHVAKMDLDSSLIRRIYAYGAAACHSQEASIDFGKVYRVSSAPPTFSSDGNFDFTDTRVDTVHLKRKLYNDVQLSDTPELMPRLEQVLTYNIQDTITVTRVLLESDVLSLVTEMTALFCLGVEASGMCGNSRRLASCLVHNGLKYGTFVATRPARTPPVSLDVYHSYSSGSSSSSSGSGEGEEDAEGAAAICRRTARIVGLGTGNDKAYQGALNYARDQSFFTNVDSFDFKSYYPNLTCFLNLDSTSCTVITVEFVQSLSPPIVAILERCVRADLVRLFAMQDPIVPTEELLTPGYRGREIGHCLCWEDMCALGRSEPVLATYHLDETPRERFIGRVLTGLLEQRRQLQEKMRATTTSTTERRILDSQQLGTKIILNSVYGVTGCTAFLYSHIPASASVTLFGRKFLTVCARLVCTFYALSQEADADDDVRAWYEDELKYLTTWAVNCSSRKAGDRPVISTADDSCSGGGSGGESDTANAAERKRRWPFADLVCYVDTDGLKFYNPMNVDAGTILKRVNDAIAFTKHLSMAMEQRHDYVMILTKKKYAYCDDNDDVKTGGGIVGHVGYERHANTVVKNILTGVVRACCESVAADPLHVIFDIFGCLHATNPCLLYERVKLNHHENESTLQRYIDSITKDYKGDVKTMLLLDEKGDVTQDLYKPLAVWSTRPTRPNLAKFIRKFHKIIERLLMTARCRHEILSDARMENPLLMYATYHVWLDDPRYRAANKIAQLVEFVRPHFQRYKKLARHRLTLEDAVDCHGTTLKKRSGGYINVLRKLI